jgi:hypothetical protein
MNTKILMTLSALLLGLAGIVLSFFPKEIVTYLNIDTNTLTILLLQMLSALYLGFGILNWMAKDSMIGGIYNKPIAIGNLMHFGVGAIALIKIVFEIEVYIEVVISLTIVYTIFAICFAYVFITNPGIKNA